MKTATTGTTGLVGKEAILINLKNPAITEVLSVSRKSLTFHKTGLGMINCEKGYSRSIPEVKNIKLLAK
ncbi:hypothetical protein N0B40_06405 [Chryseobacterium oranimense]|uniref:hypothetical protein n=1 Tax=Chryseobacterium oranimense TaxID=421058 RepID=UPI0021AE87EC|nr:hypothetical protein [Chryseobacterium oranimense]UWX61913.1 hypothetical protein N0B40_06405 [Chryseobacterium oranimense]